MKILITGAASGIGLAALTYLSKHHEITAIDVQHIDNHHIDFIRVDLGSVDDLQRFTDRHLFKYDALINAAGVREIIEPAQLTHEQWEHVMRVNVTAPFLLSQRVISNAIKNQKTASIINIASVSGILAEQDRAAYVTSKHALIGLTKQLAFQYGKNHIRVNAIAPGIIETPMTAAYFNNQEIINSLTQSIPVKRWGTTHEILSCIDLCLYNNYMTGSIITCDGGWSCGKSI